MQHTVDRFAFLCCKHFLPDDRTSASQLTRQCVKSHEHLYEIGSMAVCVGTKRNRSLRDMPCHANEAILTEQHSLPIRNVNMQKKITSVVGCFSQEVPSSDYFAYLSILDNLQGDNYADV